jgi:hypothetical protein
MALIHSQVQELFELGEGSTAAFQPATSRQLVAALLAGLHVHCAVAFTSKGTLATTSSVQCRSHYSTSSALLMSEQWVRWSTLLGFQCAGLRDAHWATACGSRPEPALLTPLTPATALALDSSRLGGADAKRQRPLAPYALARALAAAERRCTVIPDDWWASASIEHLCPNCTAGLHTSCMHPTCTWGPWLNCGNVTLVHCQRREAQVQVGVLQHLKGNAEEAWQELGHAAERLPEVGQLPSCRLLVYVKACMIHKCLQRS